MKIGAHIAGNGDIKKIFEKARDLDLEAVQIFASAPTNWLPAVWTKEKISLFKKLKKNSKITKIYFHGIYLINLASERSFFVHQSKQSLIADLNLSVDLGADGVIFHIGSSKEKSFSDRKGEVVKNIIDILKKSDPRSTLIFENSAGAGGTIGKKMDEFASIWQELKSYSSRIKFCFDSCHAFASGYDIRNIEGVNKLKKDIEKSVGLDQVVVLHINDCLGDLGSNRDRHANIGEGKIGIEGFKFLAQDNFFSELPWILEVPGFENNGPDKKNIDILKNLK